MKNKVKIYGSSDDLVEVRGSIEAEFNGDNGFLCFSDGSVFHVKYTKDGIWRILPVIKTNPKGIYTKVTEIIKENDDGYSDVVTYENDELKWVAWAETVTFALSRTMRITDFDEEE